MKRKTNIIVLCFIVASMSIYSLQTFSHCQIPCGIYGDETRFTMLEEHITTIEKSMKLINELSDDDAAAHTNQIVRWVNNKENHADAFTDIVTQYFLAQRIKPVDDADKAQFGVYTKKLVLLHKMMVSSMKAKQTTDVKHVADLKKLVKDFHDLYGHK
jgi:nickel superoxide dismutase